MCFFETITLDLFFKVILEWIFSMLAFLCMCAVVYFGVSWWIDKKGRIFWIAESRYLKKLKDYNKKYKGQDYEAIKLKLTMGLTYEKEKLILEKLKENDLLLNKSLHLYSKLKLSGNQKLCDKFEYELVKYRIIRLYEQMEQDV